MHTTELPGARTMLLGSTATRPGITGSLQAISAAFKITNYIFEKHMAVRTRKNSFFATFFGN